MAAVSRTCQSGIDTGPMIAGSLDSDLARLRSEFELFPGMCLTVEQAARLLDLPRDVAAGLLSMLESEGLLRHGTNARYRRASLPLA